MIPKIIHYCWFGRGEIPELVKKCIASWHQFIPEDTMGDERKARDEGLEAKGERLVARDEGRWANGWTYMLWNEDNFDVETAPLYVRQAYEAKKYAFVSDYVRLWALEQYGGVYLDTDVEVVRSFDGLIVDEAQCNMKAFIGFEESLTHLPGTCVMACEAHCQWIKDMLETYYNISFIKKDGIFDMTTNVKRLGYRMMAGGLIPNGKEQCIDNWGLYVFPHDYFSPITSTRVMRKSKNTYCIHHYAGSWTEEESSRITDNIFVREAMNLLVQIKRFIKGQR